MTTPSAAGRARTPSIVQLADRIENDIKNRRLRPGDSYLSAASTARMLKVGTAAANRALQLLQQRQVLVRSQRRGTFIASPSGDGQETRRINLIVDQGYLNAEGLLEDGVLVGLQSVLPQAELRFRFMPVTDDRDFVHGMIDEALQSPLREGFVLVRASLTAQQLVADSGLPAVIHGTPYPSITSIPWVERDVPHSARLVTDYLLSRGCRQFLLLLRQTVMPGDHLLLDQIQHSLADHGMSTALTVRCLPAVRNVIQHEVAWKLHHSKERVGIICRSEPLAKGAAAAVPGRVKQGMRPEIVVTDFYRRPSRGGSRWPYAQPVLSPEEIGQRIGHLLLNQFAGRPIHARRVIIPVQFIPRPG